ncbi:MAG: hypothetical protein JNM18_08165 [Planctomycetaceae bacterium]|nr:hypothetical protein [Planctomycetaceae bacterium]
MSKILRWHPDNKWQAEVLNLSVDPCVVEVGGARLRFVSVGQALHRETAIISLPRVEVWVSGQSLLGGVGLVKDRDEILVGTERVYFSTHTRPTIIEWSPAAGAKTPKCPICKADIAGPIVCCPQCGRRYHQADATATAQARHCWTLGPQCMCGHPTAIDGASDWLPDPVWSA